MVSSTGQPLKWQVNGLTIAGVAWGDPAGQPVLALHGWLDNLASFEVLGPRLEGCYVVAIDLTGHGHSDHRSPDAGYQIWDDLPEVMGVIAALGWEQFHLLGHSRGGIISTLLAGAFPEKVASLTLLDALIPHPLEEAEFALQLRKFLRDKPAFLGREHRLYSCVDDAVAVRVKRGLGQSAAERIVSRNLQAVPGGWRWRTDPRLHGASAVKLTHNQNVAVLKRLTMPTLLLLGDDEGFHPPEVLAVAETHIEQLRIERFVGGHHFHMESEVDSVAHCVLSGIQP